MIVYLVDCLDVEKFVKNNPCNQELIKKVIPWIIDFTDKVNYTKNAKL